MLKTCPRCGIKHKSSNKAYHCYRKTENEYGFFIILTCNMDGGATEENLKKYKNVNIKYFNEVEKLYEKMKKYYNNF